MGRVHDDHVCSRADECLGALERVGADADRRRRPQPSLVVLRRVGELDLLLDVLDRDQPAQPAIRVDDRELLDLVPVQDLLGLRQRRPDRRGDEVARRHQSRDGLGDVVLEAKVPVGEDADEDTLVVRDRDARDLVARHQFERGAHRRVGRQRDRLDDHPRLRPLHLVDLGDLRLDREVAVDDADSTLARERDREARFGDRVHRGRDDRDREVDRARQAGTGRDVVRQDVRGGRDEEDVVEGEALAPELPVELQQPLNVVGAQLGCYVLRQESQGTKLNG